MSNMVPEQGRKVEQDTDKGTISEGEGHTKWTGVVKLIGQKGQGKEKKND